MSGLDFSGSPENSISNIVKLLLTLLVSSSSIGLLSFLAHLKFLQHKKVSYLSHFLSSAVHQQVADRAERETR